MEDDKIKQRSSLSLVFLSSACAQRSELPKPFAELADTTTHARLVWTPPHLDCSRSPAPTPTQATSRAASHDANRAKKTTPNQAASAIGPRCRRRVPVGTSDEGRQRVASNHPSVFGLADPPRLNRSPQRKAERRPVRDL